MTHVSELQFPLLKVLNADGTVCGEIPDIPAEKQREMYRGMVLARTLDQRAFNLQRQGRIGTYAPFSGQEAAQIGSFALLEQDDWIASSYRELAGLVYHGLPLAQALLVSMGHPHAGYMPENLNVFPIQIIIAAQTLHAVGTAWASKLKGEKNVSVTYFGDGATSEGDFHEALNFAAVYKVPVIFFCQNNHWAISVPVSQQMATPTIAQKAVAYNMEGIRVDGNDVLAVYTAMKKAVERARAGEGPTLIEAVTYRLGPHTTADDPTRYRDEEVWKGWQERDPLIRYRQFLQSEQLWSDEDERLAWEEAKQKVEEAVEMAESFPKPDPAALFDHVYESLPDDAAEQKRELQERLTRGEGY